MRSSPTSILLAAAFALTASAAHGQSETPATGLAFWIRLPGTSAQEFTAASAGGPRFGVGVRTGRLLLGLGVGHTSWRVTTRSRFQFPGPTGASVSGTTEDEVTATLFQIGPTAIVDVWRSSDARTRANIAAGLSIGRVSLINRDEFPEFPTGDIMSDEGKATGTLLGFHLAFGGDYFLHRHFALGAEAGYQGSAARNIEENEQPLPDQVTVAANGTYVALRVTVVF